MADLSPTYFVDINISTTVGAVSATTFGTPLILTDEGTYDDDAKYREYASPEEVAEDWEESTTAYKKALDIFSQDLTVDTVKIATCATYVAQVQTIVFDAVLITGNSVSAEVDGTEITQAFDTDHLTTMTALAAQIAALAGVSTATVGGTGNRTITVTAQTTGVLVDIQNVDVTGGASQAEATVTETTPNQGPVDDLTDLIAESTDNFYLIFYTNTNLARVKAVTAYVESLKKQYFTYTNASEALDAEDDTDLGSWLKANSYKRTKAIYSDDSENEADACVGGLFLPQEVGNFALHGKTPKGLSSDDLTTTQYSTLTNKGYLFVGTLSQLTKLIDPPRTDGAYADSVRSDDAFEAFLREGILNFQFAQNQVDYNNAGISSYLSEIKRLCELAKQKNYIERYDDPTAPDVSDISLSDKTARHLPDIELTAYQRQCQ